jgi:hypothetical protein
MAIAFTAEGAPKKSGNVSCPACETEMNDNRPPPIAEPELDAHADGKRGFLFGVVVAALVIGLVWWLLWRLASRYG